MNNCKLCGRKRQKEEEEVLQMKNIPVVKCQLVKESSVSADPGAITSPSAAAAILSNYLDGADREHFVVLMLNTKNKPIGINTVSIGTINSSLVHPREVFKPAILASAAGIILGHNHPSGDTQPSREDREITKRLKEAGDLLGIQVLDHVIIGDSFLSLREQGLMGEPSQGG